MPVRLVYETHATTLDNENGIATGWLPGELSAAGRENAAELGRRRRDDCLDLVLASDLARAVETCRIAFAGSGIEMRTDARLRECDYGELNGAPTRVVHGERLARVDRPYPGGQSYRQVASAVGDLLDELAAERDGQRVLLVGHAATRFALDHLLAARPLEAAVVAPFAWRPGWEYPLGADRPTMHTFDGPAAMTVADEVVAAYRAAFTASGYDETEEQVGRFATETLPRHSGYAGFRLVLLREAGVPLGFAYGYTGEHGQWWTDRVAATAPGEAAGLLAEWLGGHFEVVELAVDPRAQGRGLGAALLETLLLGLPHDRALLTTYADNRPAPRLYSRLGWQRLVRGVLQGDSDLWGLDLTTAGLRR